MFASENVTRLSGVTCGDVAAPRMTPSRTPTTWGQSLGQQSVKAVVGARAGPGPAATVQDVDTSPAVTGPLTTRAPRALLVAAFDSQLKWAAHLGAELAERGFDCRYVAPRERVALSADQVQAAGADRVDLVWKDEILDLALDVDVVVLALAGPQVRHFTLDLAERLAAEPREEPAPVMVAGWVGVIIEKITAGYLDRSGADVVAVNARHELDHFREVAHLLDIDPGNLLLSGLPLLSTSPRPQPASPVRTVLFADQPTVPDTAADRLYVYRRLAAYARRHPNRRVLLKPRHRQGEDTFHRMHHHPEELLSGDELPANLTVEYRPIPELLRETDLLVTMSSTACLEAIDHGVRVALVLDLGVHERYGNHVFLDSGLLRTFDQLEADDIGSPSAAWVDSWFGGRSVTPAQAVVDRVEKLLATGERPSLAAMTSPYQQGAIELHRARLSGEVPDPPGPWTRRRKRHGVVKGTALQLGIWLIPPAALKPLKKWRNQRRIKRL